MAAQMELIPDDFRNRMDELRKDFGSNKIIPVEIEMQCLAALSFFSEFRNLYICFEYRRLNTTMASLPAFSRILKKKANRKYIIYINDNKKTDSNVFLNHIPFNAQIGVIGHELAHITDYLKKNSFSLLITGLRYFFRSFRRKYEKQTDINTIQHGLGWALYDFTYFIMHSPLVADKYKNRLRKYYLNAEDIFELIPNK